MENDTKTDIRNYLTAAGFFMIASGFLVSLIKNIGQVQHVGMNGSIEIVIGTVLAIISTLLVVLRKRDLIATFFIMMTLVEFYGVFAPMGLWSAVLVGFLLLLVLITLLSNYKKKWLIFLFPLIWFIFQIVRAVTGYSGYLLVVFFALLVILCLYYSLCCVFDRANLPGRKYLIEDEETDFKKSGSLLEYMFFILLSGGYAVYYLVGESSLPLETMTSIAILCGAFMIYVAVLLITVSKMRFTPFIFMLIGASTLLSMYTSGFMFLGIGILFVILGLYSLMRKESRILLGIMLIIYGGSYAFTAYAGDTMASAPVVSAILNVIPCLIAIYLAFVVYRQNKLSKI